MIDPKQNKEEKVEMLLSSRVTRFKIRPGQCPGLIYSPLFIQNTAYAEAVIPVKLPGAGATAHAYRAVT